MSEFLQAWLKDSIINIITEVFQNEYKGSNIENEIKILSFKKNPRVQIDKVELINRLIIELFMKFFILFFFAYIEIIYEFHKIRFLI